MQTLLPLSFRFANETDIPVLVDIHLEALTLEEASLPKDLISRDEKQRLAYLLANKDTVILASDEQKILGYMIYSEDPKTNQLEISDFYTREHGKGIGNSLFMKFCKMQEVAKDVCLFALDVEDTFYFHRGFVHHPSMESLLILPAERMQQWKECSPENVPHFS